MKKVSNRVTSNKSKHLLVENELKKLEKFDAAYFRGKNCFDGDGTQNYLVFQPIYRYFKKIAGVGSGNYISFGNLKVCLIKGLILILHPVTVLLEN